MLKPGHKDSPRVVPEEVAGNMDSSFAARPPRAGIESFAATGQPPYSIGTTVAPRVLAPVPVIHSGPQPSYHVRATITPVHRLDPSQPLKYEVTAGPNERGELTSIDTANGQAIMAHMRPELHHTNSHQLTIKPTNADILADGLVDEKGHTNRVGAQVHVYSGSEGLGTKNIVNRLILPGEEKKDVRRPVNKQQLSQLSHSHGSRSIPRRRVTEEHHAKRSGGMFDAVRPRNWWQKSVQKFRRSFSGQPDEDLSKALERELSLGLEHAQQSSHEELPPEAVPLERGYSRLIPTLVSPTDDEQPRTFNWIVSTGEVKDAEVRAAIERGELGKEGGFFDRLLGKTKQTEEEDRMVPLYFQGSEQLAQFLDEPCQGMHWEDNRLVPDDENMSLDDENGQNLILRPSVVYGGVVHAAPEYAGRLPPLSYLVSVIELHQYLKMSGSKHPWFLEQRLDPHSHAMFGPVALPFDPSHTGMPAPTLAPQIMSFFNYELPCDYDARAKLIDQPIDQLQGGEQPIQTSSAESASEESSGTSKSSSSTSEEPEMVAEHELGSSEAGVLAGSQEKSLTDSPSGLGRTFKEGKSSSGKDFRSGSGSNAASPPQNVRSFKSQKSGNESSFSETA